MTGCMAWFEIADPGEFHRAVQVAGAAYEGSGVDKRTGVTEGFAVFADAKKLEAFAKKNRKLFVYVDRSATP